MSIEGRINIDALFHDTDGTASLKVLSLQRSESYTTGKVAIFSGTLGTSPVTVAETPNIHSYRDASGQIASFNLFERVAFITSRSCELNDNINGPVRSKGNLSIFDSGSNELQLIPGYTSGTASYTVVVWGT